MLSGKKVAAHSLTASHEHYLRGIWAVRERMGYARLTDVARELRISHPTLSVGLRPLIVRRLVAHDAHRFLALTPRGERVAREVHHRFQVLRAFLEDALGVPAKQAEREACLMEHDLGADTVERIVNLLKLMTEDRTVERIFHDRLPRYQRSCKPSEACSTCGLACLVPVPRG
jgi:DtxR family transcriptional regulator, Mn-dependent transcriptional regulator